MVELPDEMKPITRELFAFLQKSDVPYKVVRSGENRGVWFPMAKLLRVCKYRSPEKGSGLDPLENIRTAKMLISGAVQTAIEMSDFGRMCASFCEVSEAKQFGASYLTHFFLPVFKSSFVDQHAQGDLLSAVELLESQAELASLVDDPHLLHAMQDESSRMVVAPDGEVRLMGYAPDPDVVGFQGLVDHFVQLNPEWAADAAITVVKPDGTLDDCLSEQFIVAFGEWFNVTYPHLVSDASLELQRVMKERIIDAGEDFTPRRAAPE